MAKEKKDHKIRKTTKAKGLFGAHLYSDKSPEVPSLIETIVTTPDYAPPDNDFQGISLNYTVPTDDEGYEGEMRTVVTGGETALFIKQAGTWRVFFGNIFTEGAADGDINSILNITEITSSVMSVNNLTVTGLLTAAGTEANISHDTLEGINTADDPHTMYFLSAGKAGSNQSLIGSQDAGYDLILKSSSNTSSVDSIIAIQPTIMGGVQIGSNTGAQGKAALQITGASGTDSSQLTLIDGADADFYTSLKVDSSGNLSIKARKDSGSPSITLTTMHDASTGSGDVIFNTKGDVRPNEDTPVTDLGTSTKKWKDIWGENLRVQTLVNEEVIATIGGRVLVAPSSTLKDNGGSISATDTSANFRHNAWATGTYIVFKNAGQIEYMRVGAKPASASGTGADGEAYYTYPITKPDSGTSARDGSGTYEWKDGDTAVSWCGSAVGDGMMELFSENSITSETLLAGNVYNGAGIPTLCIPSVAGSGYSVAMACRTEVYSIPAGATSTGSGLRVAISSVNGSGGITGVSILTPGNGYVFGTIVKVIPEDGTSVGLGRISVNNVTYAQPVGPTILGRARAGTSTYTATNEVWAIGNLDNTFGNGGGTKYGFAAGNYANNSTWIQMDNVDGIKVKYDKLNTKTLFSVDANGSTTIGHASADTPYVFIAAADDYTMLDSALPGTNNVDTGDFVAYGGSADHFIWIDASAGAAGTPYQSPAHVTITGALNCSSFMTGAYGTNRIVCGDNTYLNNASVPGPITGFGASSVFFTLENSGTDQNTDGSDRDGIFMSLEYDNYGSQYGTGGSILQLGKLDATGGQGNQTCNNQIQIWASQDAPYTESLSSKDKWVPDTYSYNKNWIRQFSYVSDPNYAQLSRANQFIPGYGSMYGWTDGGFDSPKIEFAVGAHSISSGGDTVANGGFQSDNTFIKNHGDYIAGSSQYLYIMPQKTANSVVADTSTDTIEHRMGHARVYDASGTIWYKSDKFNLIHTQKALHIASGASNYSNSHLIWSGMHSMGIAKQNSSETNLATFLSTYGGLTQTGSYGARIYLVRNSVQKENTGDLGGWAMGIIGKANGINTGSGSADAPQGSMVGAMQIYFYINDDVCHARLCEWDDNHDMSTGSSTNGFNPGQYGKQMGFNRLNGDKIGIYPVRYYDSTAGRGKHESTGHSKNAIAIFHESWADDVVLYYYQIAGSIDMAMINASDLSILRWNT